MGVRQQALGHAHRQERNAGFFDERADLIVGLGIGGALAENDQWTLGVFEYVERALDGRGCRDLRRRGINDLDQRFGAGFGIDYLSEQFRRKIEIDAAWTARNRGADR